MNQLIQRLSEGQLIGPVACAVLAMAALVIYLLWRACRGHRRGLAVIDPTLRIDVDALGDEGPPQSPPTLEFYNIPVRLAAIVLAPAGRPGILPPPKELSELVDSIVPGLAEVMVTHAPLRRHWPAQLSSSGFAHAFFAAAHLPGNGGRGTPWASVAGTVKSKGRSVMVALVVRAARPNSFGQRVMENEGDWLHALSVRLD